MRGKAYRRKQYAKRRRFWYRRDMAELACENPLPEYRQTTYLWGGNKVAGEERARKGAAFMASTPGWCSCWCCSDHRRRLGEITRQEQRSADAMRQQIEEWQHAQEDERRRAEAARRDDDQGVRRDPKEHQAE